VMADERGMQARKRRDHGARPGLIAV
jgi:hypothetical protein